MSSVIIAGDTSGTITLAAPATAGSSVLTLPVATDTLVGKATTDTLTNKTLTAPVLGTPASGILTSCTGLNYDGFKNKIIGGDFTVNPWQRGTSFAAIASGDFSADRWNSAYVSSAVVTASKATDAPTAAQAGIFTQYCLSLAVTTVDATIAAGDIYIYRQNIEGLNVASFGFGQAGSRNVTLSFWVKGTKTGIYCACISNSANNRAYVAEYTIAVTNTWEYKTITIPVDTTGTWLYDTGRGLIVNFVLAAGTTYQTTANTWAAGNLFATANQVNALDNTSNVFKIALVQLEAGSVATSFDVRSVGTELALCQRYFIKDLQDAAQATFLVGVVNSATTADRCGMRFPATMRAAPTAAVGGTSNPRIYNGAAVPTITSISANSSSTFGASLSLTASAGGLTTATPAIIIDNSASFFTYSAEL